MKFILPGSRHGGARLSIFSEWRCWADESCEPLPKGCGVVKRMLTGYPPTMTSQWGAEPPEDEDPERLIWYRTPDCNAQTIE